MTYAEAWNNVKRVLTKGKNLRANFRGQYLTDSNAIKDNPDQYPVGAIASLLTKLQQQRERYALLRGELRAELLDAFTDIAREIGSGTLIGGRITDEAQFFEDWRKYMADTADERVAVREVTFASAPAAGDYGVLKRLTVDHRGQTIEAGYHNQTKTFEVTQVGLNGAGDGQGVGQIYGEDAGEDALDYQGGSGGKNGPRSLLEIRQISDLSVGRGRNSQLFVSGATTDGTAVTQNTLGSWTLENISGTPTVVVRATGNGAVWRRKTYGIAVKGNATTWKISQDLIGLDGNLFAPKCPGVVLYYDGVWTGTLTLGWGQYTEAITESAFSGGAGFYLVTPTMDEKLYPINLSSSRPKLSVQIATTHASGELVLHLVDIADAALHENIPYWWFAQADAEATAGVTATFADTNDFTGDNQDLIAWAFEEAPYAYLNTAGTNLVSDV